MHNWLKSCQFPAVNPDAFAMFRQHWCGRVRLQAAQRCSVSAHAHEGGPTHLHASVAADAPAAAPGAATAGRALSGVMWLC